jgi:hypothetical protein
MLTVDLPLWRMASQGAAAARWSYVFRDGSCLTQVAGSEWVEVDCSGNVKFSWAHVHGSPPEAVEFFDPSRGLSLRAQTGVAMLRAVAQSEWLAFDVAPGVDSAGSWKRLPPDGPAADLPGAPNAFHFHCGGGFLRETTGGGAVWVEYNALGSRTHEFDELLRHQVAGTDLWEVIARDRTRKCAVLLTGAEALLWWPSDAALMEAATDEDVCGLPQTDFFIFTPRTGADSRGLLLSAASLASLLSIDGSTPLPPVERPNEQWAFACVPESYLCVVGSDPVSCNLNYFRRRALELQRDPSACAPLMSVPSLAESRTLLPQLHWPGNPTAVACYWKVWELAFRNLRARPRGLSSPDASRRRIRGIPFPFIDTAFSDCLFLWDSVFILSFARYARRASPFWQGTLDNFYATALPDGFISKELRPSGHFQYYPHDPCSTGPNVLAWSEWDHYRQSGDIVRLSRVFWPILSYHRWTRENRTWQDGSYWTNGLASGMDNIPRADRKVTLAHDQFASRGQWGSSTPLPPSAKSGGAANTSLHSPWLSHGHMSWVDATAQALLSAECLVAMAHELGRRLPEASIDASTVEDLVSESQRLLSWLQLKAWDSESCIFHDVDASGSRTPVRHVGGYWPLLAGAATAGAARQVYAAGATPVESAADTAWVEVPKPPTMIPAPCPRPKSLHPHGLARSLSDGGDEGSSHSVGFRLAREIPYPAAVSTDTEVEASPPPKPLESTQSGDTVEASGSAEEAMSDDDLARFPNARKMAEQLHDPAAFGTIVAVPSLVASDSEFDSSGGYWRGGVWAPTTYMVLRGLRRAGLTADEHAVALRHVEAVWKVFETTGTVHENYAPCSAAPGRPAKGDFVGWSGLGPVAMTIESVMGITTDWMAKSVVWCVRLTDEHGVDRLPFGESDWVSLRAAARPRATAPPKIHIESTATLTLIVRWPAGDAPASGERVSAIKVEPGKRQVSVVGGKLCSV